MGTSAPLTITDALLTDGVVTTVRLVDGLVHSLGLPAQPGDVLVDGAGRLLLPAMAEAHAHLDKAFLAEVVPNPTGDLMGAILAIDAARGRITEADTEARAERAARLIAANGATAIRTHADVNGPNGLTSVHALLAVKERLRDLVHLEIIALCGSPSIGPDGAQQRALLREALAMGVDGVGGCPHLEDDPIEANDVFLTIAAEAGVPIDLHTDETLNPERVALEDLADRVLATGFPHRVAASHCVSLGMQSQMVQQRVAEKVAAAGIAVITLPSSNLFLQGREHQSGMPRSLTAIKALRDAGATVAAGADNLQDPFNPMGRGDCMETASLMVMAGHQLPDAAYDSVSTAVRALMGLPVSNVSIGSAADLVLVPATTVREAIAFGPVGRTVIRAGRRVAG